VVKSVLDGLSHNLGCLVENDAYGVAAALEKPEADPECLVPTRSVVCLGCNVAATTSELSEDAFPSTG
jgi:hypothetical protein